MFGRYIFLKLFLCWSVLDFIGSTDVLGIQPAQHSFTVKDAGQKFDYGEAELEGEIKSRPKRELPKADEIVYRLPNTLRPTNYDLYIHPDMQAGNFSGKVNITVQVLEETSQIILHSHKLLISKVFVNNSEIDNFYMDEIREFLVIDMKQPLEANTSIRLFIQFGGEMLNKIVGLYRSTYIRPNEEKRTIATTKFQPTHARESFPCFDEPNMKATFRITLTIPSKGGYHALSNMKEESSLNMGEYTQVRFAESVPMSTYIVSFIVSDFAYKSRTIPCDSGFYFDLRIFATAHQLDKTDFALDTAVAVMEFYIKNFKFEYPLSKLDMAAIPDFGIMAMENWGLVTYRETVLLYDRDYSSTWNKQFVAAIVAHELSHMWFGNLVTMNWWNDLWLNEGFAKFMEFKSINAIYKHWTMMDQFLIQALHGVMKFDSSVASHPIIQTVENPDQITQIFDQISYQKGASIIRMLEDIIGVDKFELAVTNYLMNFKYQNAITEDFLNELQKTGVDFDVKFMMRTWTEQMGFPVVNVKRLSNTTFELKQQRFFSKMEDYDKIFDDSEFNYKWTIPITFNDDTDSKVRRVWLNNDNDSIIVTVPEPTKWLKLNSHQVGYYRVNYEDEMWLAIIDDLVKTPQKFAISDRAHLLNDVFSLADANQVSYKLALDMTTYLSNETDFVPWYVAANKLQDLQGSLMFTEAYMDYLRYARDIIGRVYEEVTWHTEDIYIDSYSSRLEERAAYIEDDNHLRNRLRVSILNAACSLGLPACLHEASQRFTAYLANPKQKPHPDLREIIYYYGMQHIGNQQSWEQMRDIFVAEHEASEKSKLMYGLAAVKIPWLLKRYIVMIKNEEFMRRQDYFTCIKYISTNPVGTEIVWDYVRENWYELVDLFGLSNRHFGRMISSITERFATQTKLEEMLTFFSKNPEAGAGTADRKQALETVKFNINWLKSNLEEVKTWLAQHKN